METRFTEGEWYCVFGGAYACVRINGKVVADLRTVNAAYNKHDAQLIAAAPEMYVEVESEIEFLKELREGFDTVYSMIIIDERISHKEKLLAKARGELLPLINS